MDEQQAPADSQGKAPLAGRTPSEGADKGYELPPPPGPGALWGASSGDDQSSAKSGSSYSSKPVSVTPSNAPTSGTSGRASVPGRIDSPGDSRPTSSAPGGTSRSMPASPGAGA